MSGNSYLDYLELVAASDVEGLREAQRHYGDSWKQEGGFSAWFNIKRKIDRLVQLMKRPIEILNLSRSDEPNFHRVPYDIFGHIFYEVRKADGQEAVLDALRDLRRYAMLVEAEMLAQGLELPLQRDNRLARERRSG